MAESIKLIQIRCPNCQSTLSRADRFETQVKCPYCTAAIDVARVPQKPQYLVAPEHIILFQTSEKDFERAVCNFLLHHQNADNAVGECDGKKAYDNQFMMQKARQYIPGDILDKVEMNHATAMYLPMFLYEGVFEAAYTCSLEKIKPDAGDYYDEDGFELIIQSHRGTVRGDYAFLCLAYEGQEIVHELSELTMTFPYDPAQTEQFKPEHVRGTGCQILPHNLGRKETWHKRGMEKMTALAEREAKNQHPEHMMSCFKPVFSYAAKHAGRLVMAPFWMVCYDYNDKKYFVMMDGLGKYVHGSQPPQDKKLTKEVEKWETFGDRSKLFAVCMGMLVCLFNYWAGIVVIGVVWFGLPRLTARIKDGVIETAYRSRIKAYNRIVCN